jgi:hypothetical protein
VAFIVLVNQSFANYDETIEQLMVHVIAGL